MAPSGTVWELLYRIPVSRIFQNDRMKNNKNLAFSFQSIVCVCVREREGGFASWYRKKSKFFNELSEKKHEISWINWRGEEGGGIRETLKWITGKKSWNSSISWRTKKKILKFDKTWEKKITKFVNRLQGKSC